MLKKNKKIIIYLIVGIILIVSMFFVFNKKEEYKELPRVKLKDSINTSGLAIMVESDYKTEQYKKWENSEFPTNGYTLNRIKSGCVDKNGNNIDALTYNEDNKTISIKTKQSVYCYLYYDSLFKGSGTEDEPYEINYIEDLVRLSNSVNKDSNNYDSKYFILKRNLDFNTNDSYMKYNDTGFGDINGVSGVEGIKDELTNQEGSGFIPIGFDLVHDAKKYFSGIFNGNNNTIKNLYIKELNTEQSGVGFFGVVVNGTLKNLTLSGSLYVENNNNIGAFVGYLNGGTIENCVNETIVKSNLDNWGVGGFVGSSVDTIVLKNLTNRGQIINGGSIGGIMGGNDGGSLTIENCYNYGTIVEGQSVYVIGGIIGFSRCNTKIENSANYGEIINDNKNDVMQSIGGLIGQSIKELEIINSSNKGTITHSRTIYNNFIQINIGGLVGLITNTTNDLIITKINNSYNEGTITGGTYVGGIVGLNSNNVKTIINKCYNNATIDNSNLSFTDETRTALVVTGGIVGFNNGNLNNNYIAYNIILNSYNNKEIKGLEDVGGIIGLSQSMTSNMIFNSYNMGNLSNKKLGICGIGTFNYYNSTFDKLIMKNVINFGLISSSGTGIYGFGTIGSQIDYKITNAYYNNANSRGTNLTDTSIIGMSESDMKNQNFADLLNSNLASIDLKTIDPLLDGYTLSRWKLDNNNYPTLDYNLETE